MFFFPTLLNFELGTAPVLRSHREHASAVKELNPIDVAFAHLFLAAVANLTRAHPRLPDSSLSSLIHK